MVVWAAFNITRLHNAITQKDQLISELKNAANEIKTLREILPICSFCKRIRDDKATGTRWRPIFMSTPVSSSATAYAVSVLKNIMEK